jgi:hypothetical protein
MTNLSQNNLLLVSPCGNNAAWVHQLEIGEKWNGWIDAISKSDSEFEAFIFELQAQANNQQKGMLTC